VFGLRELLGPLGALKISWGKQGIMGIPSVKNQTWLRNPQSYISMEVHSWECLQHMCNFHLPCLITGGYVPFFQGNRKMYD